MVNADRGVTCRHGGSLATTFFNRVQRSSIGSAHLYNKCLGNVRGWLWNVALATLLFGSIRILPDAPSGILISLTATLPLVICLVDAPRTLFPHHPTPLSALLGALFSLPGGVTSGYDIVHKTQELALATVLWRRTPLDVTPLIEDRNSFWRRHKAAIDALSPLPDRPHDGRQQWDYNAVDEALIHVFDAFIAENV